MLYINTGSSPNSGNGDVIRTAFNKVNSNFHEVTTYVVQSPFPPATTASTILWYDTVGGRTYTYYEDTWVDISPVYLYPTATTNTTGVVKVDGTTINVNTSGTIGVNVNSFGASIVPAADNTYDLGSTSSQWRHIYVSTGSIYLGEVKLSSENGQLSVQQVAQILNTVTNVYQETVINDYAINNTTLLANGTYTLAVTTSGNVIFPDGSTQNTAYSGFVADGSTIVNNAGLLSLSATAFPGGVIPSSYYLTNGNANFTLNNNGSVTFDDGSTQVTAWRGSTSTLKNGSYSLSLSSTGTISLNGVSFANASGIDTILLTSPIVSIPSGTLTAKATAGSAASAADSVGYLGVPQNAPSTGYIASLSDQGKHIYCTGTTFTVSIPANVAVSFPIGSVLEFIASPTTTVTISINIDTMYLSGTGSSGNRTLAPYGIAKATKVLNNVWYISGTGLS